MADDGLSFSFPVARGPYGAWPHGLLSASAVLSSEIIAPALAPAPLPPGLRQSAGAAGGLAARWAAAIGGETPPLRSVSPPLLLGTGAALPPGLASYRPPPPVMACELLCATPVRAVGAAGERERVRERELPPTAYLSPAAACNTPTAAAALGLLGAQAQHPARSHGQPQGLLVQCAHLRGTLLAAAHPLRILLPSGAALSPLDFERASGVLSKKWRQTVKVVGTGQALGDWLSSRGLGHLCSQGGAGPPRGGAATGQSYGRSRSRAPAFDSASDEEEADDASEEADEEPDEEEEEEEEAYEPSRRRRRAASRSRGRTSAPRARFQVKRPRGGTTDESSDGEGGTRSPAPAQGGTSRQPVKVSTATAQAEQAASKGAKQAALHSRVRSLPGLSPPATPQGPEFDVRVHIRITPLVLCGEGCEVEALAGGLWSATSSKGYKTVLATHGFTAGTFRCEVKLHRLSSGAGARLGYATETVQLGASVGADPSGFAIVSATGLAVTAGRSSDVVGHPTAPFKEGDTVGLCLHLPAAAADNDEQQPCDEPSDVVALTAALDARAGWSRHARHKPGQHVHTAHTLPGSAMSYNVNGGAWRVAFQDGIPASQRMHAAISLFTDPTRSQIATQACAIFNPGPVFAFDAPTCASMPPPRPLSELGPTLGPVGPPVEPVEPATAPEPLPLPLSPVYVRNES